MSGAIPLFPLWAFLAACRVNFTLTVTNPEDADQPHSYPCEHLNICAQVAIRQKLFDLRSRGR